MCFRRCATWCLICQAVASPAFAQAPFPPSISTLGGALFFALIALGILGWLGNAERREERRLQKLRDDLTRQAKSKERK